MSALTIAEKAARYDAMTDWVLQLERSIHAISSDPRYAPPRGAKMDALWMAATDVFAMYRTGNVRFQWEWTDRPNPWGDGGTPKSVPCPVCGFVLLVGEWQEIVICGTCGVVHPVKNQTIRVFP